MKRDIIEIDDQKCNGCGVCVPNCHEGALQIINGKARLISDLFCDGLGACIGHCPQNAITITQKETIAYDEVETMKKNIIPAGPDTIKAHLMHLLDHKQVNYYTQAIDTLISENVAIPPHTKVASHCGGGCPGSAGKSFAPKNNEATLENIPSELSHWPIQLHLINPNMADFENCELLIAADCSAFSFGNFHQTFLKDKKLVIACPKLDSNKDIYIEKIAHIISSKNLKSLTVVRMEVPCCGGLVSLVEEARTLSGKTIPIQQIIIGIQGSINQIKTI
ncbi:MAG: 4Fe-4S ferredoxin [Fusobacteria bacterium]|nr:4Fe-4S ferredoxin [Fusobacteriota bacterium]